jgi:hypothetical protein
MDDNQENLNLKFKTEKKISKNANDRDNTLIKSTMSPITSMQNM